jgi:hypothetical protein
MDIVERYLAAIERGLPTAQAADIKAELRDVLLSRIEEQEERLGHPLSREELDALLVEFGHPLIVAGRYRKIQHLIGPDVFPFWWAALKTTLSIVAGVYLVLCIVAVVAEGTAPIMQRIWPSLWSAMLIAFAIVTLVGVVIELYTPPRVLHKWRPGQLPPAGRKMRSRFEIAAEIAMGIVFLLWWSGFIHLRNVLPVRERLQIDMAPVWTDYHWPIFAFVIFAIGVNLYAMAKPGQSRVNSGLGLLRYGLGAVILMAVLQAGHWLVVTGGPISPEGADQIARNFDTGMRTGLVATIAYFAVRAGWEALRLVTGREARAMGT